MSSHCLLRALFSGPNKTLLTYSSQVSSPSPLIPRQFSMTLAQTQTLRRLRRAHSPCSVGCFPRWRLFSSHLAQRLVLGPPGFTVQRLRSPSGQWPLAVCLALMQVVGRVKCSLNHAKNWKPAVKVKVDQSEKKISAFPLEFKIKKASVAKSYFLVNFQWDD